MGARSQPRTHDDQAIAGQILAASQHAKHPGLTTLRAMLAVERLCDCRAAATALRMAPNALRRRVSAFERWLGAPLFVWGPGEVTATPLGIRFLAETQEAVALLDQAIERARRAGRSEGEAPKARPFRTIEPGA